MGKRITIVVAALIVLGVAFLLLTAQRRKLGKTMVAPPAVVPQP